MLPTLSVTVAGHPIRAAALIERGRVLLPMRKVFEALGASVSYDPRGRIVVAREASRNLRLQIGSPFGIVDGRRIRLGAAARIIKMQTYVPLRFAAQALGASVQYDAATRTVSVFPAALRSAPAPVAFALTPPDGGSTATAYPVISATLKHSEARLADVRLTVDGTDVTTLATFDGSTITYIPRTGLAAGTHVVTFAGTTLLSEPFNAHWSFATVVAPANENGAVGVMDDFDFYAAGSTYFRPGDWMHFVLLAPPGGSADVQLCTGFDYPLWNGGTSGIYRADAPAPLGYWIPSCIVSATYTSWTGAQTFVPEELSIALYTQNEPFYNLPPTPRPTGTPRAIPRGPRRPEPTPTPQPAPQPSPHPLPTRHPLPLPTHFPRPIPPAHVRPHPVAHAHPVSHSHAATHSHGSTHSQPAAHSHPAPKPKATAPPSL